MQGTIRLSPILSGVGALAALCVTALAQTPSAAKYTRIYSLKAEEGVFAYARIAPDGRKLAYASEAADPLAPGRLQRTIVVVDLATRTILLRTPGVDAYWSNDGGRLIYRETPGTGPDTVAIWHDDTGAISRDVAPVNLGDYYSWAVRDGQDVILTIASNYYFLLGDQGVMPARRVPACSGIGVGDRPLISKDGQRITTFVRGNIVVRDLTDCDNVLDTGVQGAKADFSWDGRYIAFHAPKPDLTGYEIEVVDTVRRTIRTVTSLPGSSLFPSWTRDGRLCFRYDGDDYRGFLIEENVLSAPERPLSGTRARIPAGPRWAELFPETPMPPHRVMLVMIWAPWSAHSPQALKDLQRADEWFREHAEDVGAVTAIDIGSVPSDVSRMRQANGITLLEVPLSPERFVQTEALNQIPTTILFRNGIETDRRLGAQTFDELRAWTGPALAGVGHER